MPTPPNTFEVRYPKEVHTHPVASAGFLAVRFSGGVGVVIVVSCGHAGGGPDFSMVLPLQGLSLEPGSEWPFRLMDLSATGVGVPPTMTDVDFHLIPVVTVTVLGCLAGAYHLRLVGETGAWRREAGFAGTITIDAAFEFRGFAQHDESGVHPVPSPLAGHMKSKGQWQKYIVDEMGLQSGRGPVTEYEWRHTDRFRRLCRTLFTAPPPEPPAPPATGLIARWRRWFTRTPPVAPTSATNSPFTPQALTPPVPSLRQTKLLLAALLEHLLPTEPCFVWDVTALELARIIQRYADGRPSAEDEERVRRYADHYMVPGGAVVVQPDEVAGDRTPQLFRLVATLPPTQMQDLFIWRLVPERSRVGCDVLRCIFGRPPQPLDFDPAWRTADVVAVARSAYESNDFAGMPVLADALQDAGCEVEAVLSHCRDARCHVRGCWVLDAILPATTLSRSCDGTAS